MVNITVSTEKKLWQKYGKSFIASTVFLLVYVAGGQFYKNYQIKQGIKASAIYDKMIFGMQKQDRVEVKAEAKQLTEQFTRTPYASLAALMLAKLDIEENNLNAAKDHLHFVLKHGKGPIQQMAKVRLARVLANEKEYEAALELLNQADSSAGYKTLVEETKGDIYLMQNDKDKAIEAYRAAIAAAPPGVPLTRLQLKQTDLGVKEGS